ncbi:unnamed protein product [Didymodactylos carnosus]|uniref:Uncharacterized protein n=1 Tax=Didymodactylos carnosus TaxID=1234261 RepID=A0A814ZLB7_9BILA|nr:unnamed protein product [Didymodactylos carnosus]CAF1245386.1 unnamed protein product [Didymodactylos carnosus]CAF3499133.1 unnamed protein product [Didymodactylos carnosus]CAF4011149.1 unnamed protein product [Didymodactylos carnosus]
MSTDNSRDDNIEKERTKQRVVIIPGMGCSARHSHWYYWLTCELAKIDNGQKYLCILEDMPDPAECKESIWIPFIKNELKVDENTIIIGHSSGSNACMRLIENTRVKGVILVATSYTDLGSEGEKNTGYFNRPWNWELMRSNADWIVQLHSVSDHLIPVNEGRYVAQHLKTEYIEHARMGHYMVKQFPELASIIEKKCK